MCVYVTKTLYPRFLLLGRGVSFVYFVVSLVCLCDVWGGGAVGVRDAMVFGGGEKDEGGDEGGYECIIISIKGFLLRGSS